MACGNNCMYIVAPPLREVFRDKDTGLPLAAGELRYYKQSDHNAFKTIYAISGTPEDPIFTPLANPYTLNISGTTDEAIYLYPFDEDGNLELYYVEVWSADDILQFTQDLWPPDACDGMNPSTIGGTENFFSNPQFRMHLDIPDDEITLPITNLGPGGWQFVVDEDFTSTNSVTFEGFTETIDDPPANPPFFVEIICSTPVPAEAFKDLQKVMTDVNFLADREVTFQFYGQTATIGSTINVELIIKRDYGPTGSPADEEVITFFTLTATGQDFTYTFTLNDNVGKVIDPDVNTTSITFALRLPRSILSDSKYTNFILALGEFTHIDFPPISKEQDVALTMAGSLPVPAFDGSDDGKYVQLSMQEDGEGGRIIRLVYGESPVYDNVIIGGDFGLNPWQRSGGTTINATVNDDIYYTADRFAYSFPAEFNATANINRSTDVPSILQTGIYTQYSYHLSSTNAASADTPNTAAFFHIVEGYNFCQIAQRYSTLSFWIKGPAGAYGVWMSNNDYDKTITSEFIIHEDQVWEFKKIIIPPSPSAGGWDYTNGRGLVIVWDLTLSNVAVMPSQLGEWLDTTGASPAGSPNQFNFFGSSSNNIRWALIKLQPGMIATPLISPPIPTLMTQCQRYYEKSYPLIMVPGTSTTLTESGVGAYANYVADGDISRSRMVCYYQTRKRAAGDQTNNFIWAYDGTRGEATHGGSNVTPDTAGYFGEQTASYGEFDIDSTTVLAHFTSDVEIPF